MLETGLYPSQLNRANGLKLIKFRARIRVCTDWRWLSDDMKPRLVLVTNRHMIYECIMQFGFQLISSNPGDDTSKKEALLFACVMSLRDHGLK